MKKSLFNRVNLAKKPNYIYIALIICLFILPFSKSRSFTFNQMTPTDEDVTFERVIMQTEQQKEVNASGAGCQWPVALECSKDGDLMLYGIDVAGLYKSTDHGASWTMANSGMEARGAGMFAIDPYNSNHVLVLGLGANKYGGIHVSYDKTNTWIKTFSLPVLGLRYLWDGLEFDPTSYDESEQITKDVYLSTPYKRDTSDVRNSSTVELASSSPLQENQVGLYKSTDGGETFTLIINDEQLADGIIKVTSDGKVYVGNQYGLFLIDKENNSIQERYLENNPTTNFSKGITGLDVVNNTIYAQTWDGIYTLENGILTKITNDNYINTWPQFLEVSESNPNHIIYQVRKTVNNYFQTNTVVSFDGGSTWEYAKMEINSSFFISSWLGREKLYIIDPSNDNNVVTFGSDAIVRSVDGGLNFKQVNGISNLMQGGRFNFNYYEPDLLFFSAQDYGGVISTDGGVTYKSLSLFSGKNNFYGGFAADRDTIYGFSNYVWGSGTLTYTHDGGHTWTDTGLTASGVPAARYYSSLQSPTNPDVLFACEYYSKDRGYTWNKMNGCVSVFTFNYTGEKELYGADENGNIVVSYDSGDTWEKISNENWKKTDYLTKQILLDMAYDHVNNIMYMVVQSKITKESTSYSLEEIYKYDITNQTSKKLSIPVDKKRNHETKLSSS